MARPPPSMYARRMAKLSASIFGDLTRKTDTKSMRVVKIFKENPRYKQNEWVNYYPNHQYATEILDGLRKYGLYRDEHMEFREYQFRKKKERKSKQPS